MWNYFTSCDFQDEILKLKKLTVSPTIAKNVSTILLFLSLMDSFKILFNLFYTRDVNDKETILTQLDDFFKKLVLRNDAQNSFKHLSDIIAIAKSFPYTPMGIYLDIWLTYLLTYLVKLLNIVTISDFDLFLKFMKNIKIIKLLCPHAMFEVLQLV